MGEKTLGIDRFFRTIGLHRSSIDSVKNMDAENLGILQAYADGVNDFVSHLGFNKANSSGIFLPPEFIVLGIAQFVPWVPSDTICVLKLLNFHLSWNWGQDLLREVLEHAGLEDMIEEIFPFTAEFSHNLVTIIDPEDIKDTKFWSDQTLTDRYYASRGLTKVPKKLSIAEHKKLDEALAHESAAKVEVEK